MLVLQVGVIVIGVILCLILFGIADICNRMQEIIRLLTKKGKD